MTSRIFLVLISCLSALLIVSADAYAQPKNAPVIKAKPDDSGAGVRITVLISKRSKNDFERIELQRDDGSGFFPLAEVIRPGRKQILLDLTATAGSYSYRARMASRKKHSDWSRVALISVTFPIDGTPPEVQPTPAPFTCAHAVLPEGITECESGFEDEVLNIVNSERSKTRAQQVIPHEMLDCSSRGHTIRMIQTNTFSHDGWYESITSTGYNGGIVGQNIAYGHSTPQIVMTAWMNSPGHRTNILHPSFRHLGVSCLVSQGRRWWTQDFGG